MDERKALILIDRDKCVPCSRLICIDVCPQGILEVGADSKPQIVDIMSCTQCGVCSNLCPSLAITVTRREKLGDR